MTNFEMAKVLGNDSHVLSEFHVASELILAPLAFMVFDLVLSFA